MDDSDVMSTPKCDLRRTRHGSVLIVVLWASLCLVSVALLFGHSMLMAYRGADNDVSGKQAEQAIEGVSRYVEALLVNAGTPGQVLDLTTYETEAVPVGEAKFWLLGGLEETGNGQTRKYGLVDEASKVNINTAPLAVLKEVPGMTDELAGAIVDWRDEDDNVSQNGAESETYASKQPPYECKNLPFESIEELALVNGATREILYGEDANMNGVLDPNEDDGNKSDPPDNSDGKLDPGILEYVTVFSNDPKTLSDGTNRVDVTTAMPSDIETALSNALGQQRAQTIMGSVGPAQLRSPLDIFITSSQTGGNDAMTAEEFDQVMGSLTTTTGNTGAQDDGLYPSPINVNTASEAVLACIPGLRDIASSIVATRSTRVQPSTGLAWIVEAIGDPAVASRAGRYITGQSWQVMADVAAVGRYGRGYRRTKFIIDNGTGTPRIIYRRNLSPLGWTLGVDVRQDLALRKDRR